MILSKVDHPLLADVLRALKQEDMGGWHGISDEVLGLEEVLWEALDHHSSGVQGTQMVDEVLSDRLVILVSETFGLNELTEVNVASVGSFTDFLGNSGLSAGFGSNCKDALRKSGKSSLLVAGLWRLSGINSDNLSELLVVVDAL